jgi:hypothetical protein
MCEGISTGVKLFFSLLPFVAVLVVLICDY